MSLHHENLIRVYGIVEKDNKTMVVMELADGSLEDLLMVRRPNLTEAACIIFQILNGLVFLHSRNMMHR